MADNLSDAYAAIHADFHWQVPDDFSWAEACCSRWARDTPEATAILYDSEHGAPVRGQRLAVI